MKYIITIFFLGLNLGLLAQRPNNSHDKIEQLKISFITQKLNLNASTAENFWPIYNEYDNAKQQLYRKYKGSKSGQSISMADIEERLEHDQEMLDLRKKYTLRFSKILSPAQIENLRKAENEFRRMIIQKARDGKEEYHNNRGRGPQLS